MKIAILYGTKYGTTEKAAGLISKKLIESFEENKNNKKDDDNSIDVNLINLKEKNDININYDILIIGSSVYMGRIRKEVKNFLKKNKNTLLEKDLALFICGSNETDGIKQIKKTFPSEIVSHSIATGFLGGEFNLDKMGFFDRKIAQSIIKGSNKEVRLNDVAIDEFVQEITF